MLKSITAKELYKRFPEIKSKLWGGKFWTSGFYANTVGQYANEREFDLTYSNIRQHIGYFN